MPDSTGSTVTGSTTTGTETWVAPTREEWEKVQRHAQNKEEEAKRVHDKLVEIETAKTEAEKAALAEQGKFKDLYEKAVRETETLKRRVEEFETAQAEATRRIEARIKEATKGWQDEDRALYLRASLTAEERLEIAEARNREKASSKAPATPGFKPGEKAKEFGGFTTEAEWARHKPREYLDWKTNQAKKE